MVWRSHDDGAVGFPIDCHANGLHRFALGTASASTAG